MADAWDVVLGAEVAAWLMELIESDWDCACQVEQAIDALVADGPALGRPLVDRIHGSRLHNLKELRPGSTGSSEVRILFIFDPVRRSVLLAAGDKSGNWRNWYDENVPLAEKRYEAHLAELSMREYE